MTNNRAIKLVELAFITLLFFSGCSKGVALPNVTYLIPNNFEGSVVIFYSQKDGITPEFDGEEYIITVPDDGLIKINADAANLSGKPSFYLVSEDGKKTQLEYLYPWGPKYPEGIRSSKDITPEEENNKIFAMLYEKGNFKGKDDPVRFKSFLICKPKDINLYAARAGSKIADFLRNPAE